MRNFLNRKNFIILATGIFLGFIAFIIIHGKDNLFARVSLPQRIIEVNGPEIEKRTLTAIDLEGSNIQSGIKEAIRLLESTPRLGTETYTSENVCFHSGKVLRALRKEISFAILDTKTRQIFEKRCWFSREDAEQFDIFSQSLDRLKVLLGFKSPQNEDDRINEELALVVNWWNSHNSDIEVRSLNSDDEPGRFIIVGNKYPMANSHLAYPQDITGKKYSDIVYVPYSDAIHTPELIDEGKIFLNESVAKAFDELREAKIKSVSYPGRLVVDTIDPKFIKHIFLTEQTDPNLVLSALDGGKKLAERVLIRLGANKEKAYRYTYSSAGALGLGQIMPGTYDSIRRLYPEAKLIQDTNIGRVDIINGIKATILVFDDHYAAVLRRLNSSEQGKSALLIKSRPEIEEMKAAIYNGGPGKISNMTAQISSAIPETVDFVAKFKRIRALGLF